jgi:hypothetical protein
VQYVEYFIDRGVLGVTREVQHPVLEYRGEAVKPGTHAKWDSAQSLVVPTMPPSMVGVCRLLQLYYVLKVGQRFYHNIIMDEKRNINKSLLATCSASNNFYFCITGEFGV